MKRLIAMTGALAFAAACSAAPQSGSVEASTAKPAETTVEKAAVAKPEDASLALAPASTSGAATSAAASTNPVATVIGQEYREVTLPAGTVLPISPRRVG